MELALSAIEEEGESSYVGVIRDISDRKHTDKLKNEFIATVSHEIVNSINIYFCITRYYWERNARFTPRKVNKLIQIAKQNSFRLQNLINDLLDMDKLLSNSIKLNHSKFDAVALVQKAMAENQYIADKYQIKFQIISAESYRNIFADEARTRQVLAHLLSNAAKLSKAHMVVDISISKHNNFTKISVVDHGLGIAPELKASIFSSFTQGAIAPAQDREEGSGIGLSISKELIEKWVEK